jgi:hypothetical protein
MSWTVIVGLAVIAALAWVFGRPRRRRRHGIDDPDELAAAERAVRDLDAWTHPDEADDKTRDWGPGAP